MYILSIVSIIGAIPVLAGGTTHTLLKTHKAKKPRNSWLHKYSGFAWWRRAVTFISEICTDMSQFGNSKRLCCWAGLTPGNNECWQEEICSNYMCWCLPQTCIGTSCPCSRKIGQVSFHRQKSNQLAEKTVCNPNVPAKQSLPCFINYFHGTAADI